MACTVFHKILLYKQYIVHIFSVHNVLQQHHSSPLYGYIVTDLIIPYCSAFRFFLIFDIKESIMVILVPLSIHIWSFFGRGHHWVLIIERTLTWQGTLKTICCISSILQMEEQRLPVHPWFVAGQAPGCGWAWILAPLLNEQDEFR